MKKTLLITAFIILIPALCLAGPVQKKHCSVLEKKNVVAPSCTTQALPDDMGAATHNSVRCHAASTKWFSSEFTAGETTDICKVCLSLKSSTGTSPTYTMTVYIYSDDGSNKPNTSLGTIQAKDMTGVLTADYQTICFTGGTASVTNTTKYHIVVTCSATDGTNQLTVSGDDTCASEKTMVDDDGAGWSTSSTSICHTATLWK